MLSFESIAKLVLGSGIFIFLIAQGIEYIKKCRFKKRLKKEISFEFFMNEYVTLQIIKDFQKLQKDSCGHLIMHKYNTYAIDAILSSGYFLNMNFDLNQFIIEFRQRFRNIEYELESFFTLNDEQKELPVNLALLERGVSASQLLLSQLHKSERMIKLKNKYYEEWFKKRATRIKERYGIEIDKKKLEKVIEEFERRFKGE